MGLQQSAGSHQTTICQSLSRSRPTVPFCPLLSLYHPGPRGHVTLQPPPEATLCRTFLCGSHLLCSLVAFPASSASLLPEPGLPGPFLSKSLAIYSKSNSIFSGTQTDSLE